MNSLTRTIFSCAIAFALIIPAMVNIATPAIGAEAVRLALPGNAVRWTARAEGGNPVFTVTIAGLRPAIQRHISQIDEEIGCEWDVDYGDSGVSASEQKISFDINVTLLKIRCHRFERKIVGKDGQIRIEKFDLRQAMEQNRVKMALGLDLFVQENLTIASAPDFSNLVIDGPDYAKKLLLRSAEGRIVEPIQSLIADAVLSAKKELLSDISGGTSPVRQALEQGRAFKLSSDFQGDDLILRFGTSSTVSASGLPLNCEIVSGELAVMPGGWVAGTQKCVLPDTPQRRIKPKVILLHNSGTDNLGATIRGYQKYGVSVHFMIDRDGKIVQLVSTDQHASHAGKSHWKGLSGLNSHSIGITLINFGQMRSAGGNRWRYPNGEMAPDDDVIVEAHKFTPKDVTGWQRYSDQQIDALARLIQALRKRYDIQLDMIVGHDDVSPLRKVDPGPALDWRDLRSRLEP